MIRASAWNDGEQLGYIQKYFVINYATGRYVEYKHKYSKKYDAGFKDGLVDGILASNDFKDGNWQGFEGDDFDVIVNLKDVKDIQTVRLRFLKSEAAWIFLPEEVSVFWSADGNEYFPIEETQSTGTGIVAEPHIYEYTFNKDVEARYIRIRARNIGVCPEGHPGVGGKAWIFTDEIIVE